MNGKGNHISLYKNTYVFHIFSKIIALQRIPDYNLTPLKIGVFLQKRK